MKKITAALLLLLAAIPAIFASGMEEKASEASPIAEEVEYTPVEEDRIGSDMASLEVLYRYLDSKYLYDIDYDAVYNAMATAMFEALDETYTYYVIPDEAEDYIEDAVGEYGGLGIYFSKTYQEYQDPDDLTTLYCQISQVFSGTPAAKGGLKSKDLITRIDGQSVVELSANECSARMKGQVGTTVVLTILRGQTEFDITLTRAQITVPSVEYTMLDGNVGYVAILEFISSTATSVYKALSELKEAGATSFVLDLRDNPGGDIEVALQIADMFIADEKLLFVKYKDSQQIYKASSTVLVPETMKVAIVVNGGTASSAEILTSALKDTGRATIVGSTTYGKGIMQIISSFGEAYTSITTAEFTTLSGNTIHKNGVEPDIEVQPIYLEGEELEAYVELISGSEVSDYVDANPVDSAENIRAFAEKFAGTGIREIVLEMVAYNEYVDRLAYEEQPIADTTYDEALRVAVETVRGN